MYFKQKSNVIYRDYGSFGYITDNRNFGYKFSNNYEEDIGDRVVSETGAIFLSALSRSPQSIDILSEKIGRHFQGVDTEVIKHDAINFYLELEDSGFIVSGESFEECSNRDKRLSSQKPKEQRRDNVHEHKEDINNTWNFLDDYFEGEPQLVSLHIEITSKCNERCIHCYIPHEKKTEIMSPHMFYDILEQAREMNLLHLTISGGEPLGHDSFVDFLKKCNEYNFSVNVLSNLTLLSREIIQEMKNNPLLCVQTSLYAMDADVHDAITQKKGSFNKTKSAILELIQNDIPVQISCPIMKQNIHYYKEVIQWGKAHNINVANDYVIIAKYDHSTQNLCCRLSIDDVCKIINQSIDDDSQYLITMEKEYEQKMGMTKDDYICSVCQSSLCISENGNVYPCAGWQDYVLANINEIKLSDIWNKSDKLKYLRNLRRSDFPKCVQCSEKEFCTMCMVRNANENPQGDPLKVNQYFCDIARINKEIYFKRR